MLSQYITEIALFAMAITTLVAVGTSLYLYRWRRIITSQQALFVPEELISQLLTFRSELGMQTANSYKSQQTSKELFATVGAQISNVSHTISQLLNASTTWQNALDERDAEIRRLRSGYDLEVFRRFVARFVRVKVAVDEFIAEGDFSSRSLTHINRLLADAFDECGVEQFFATVGEDYRTANGVEDNPQVVYSTNPLDSFHIADTLAPGYRSNRHGEIQIIVPARVSIFMHKETELT